MAIFKIRRVGEKYVGYQYVGSSWVRATFPHDTPADVEGAIARACKNYKIRFGN